MNKYSRNYFKNNFQNKMIKELNSFTMNPSDKKGILIQIKNISRIILYLYLGQVRLILQDRTGNLCRYA